MPRSLPVILACILLHATAFAGPAPFELPITVSPNATPRPAGHSITVSVPIARKLDCEARTPNRTIDRTKAHLISPTGAEIPVTVQPQPDATVRLTFSLPAELPAGASGQFTLQFDTLPNATTSVPTTTATPTKTTTWDFAEGAKPVFTNPSHATVLEGGANGGYLTATADGQSPAPTIGQLATPITARAPRVLMRLRHDGPTPTALAANGITLHDAKGQTTLPDTFQNFYADLGPSDKLILTFAKDQPKPTATDSVTIDWIRLLPAAPAAYAGVVRATTESSPAAITPELYAAWFRPATCAAYVYLRNTTDQPFTLSHLYIDGREESASPWPLDPNRQADWFDLIPATVQPGQVAQLRVHLRDLARTEPVTLTAETSAGHRTSCTPPAEAAALSFSDITFSKDGSQASLFVDTDAPIKQVLLDGHDITPTCDTSGAAPHRGTAAIFYHPTKPLNRGSYHTWEVRTADNHRAIYTARTLSNDFIIGTYGTTNFAPYVEQSINHYISFGRIPPQKISELVSHNMTAGPAPFIGGEVDRKTHDYKPLDPQATAANIKAITNTNSESQIGNRQSAIAYYSSPDEPDGADYPLGVGTHGRSIVAMRHLAGQLDPATPCFVQIDNTYRNRNYHVYAEAMDYSSTHRYNLGQDFLASDRSAMKELRDSTAPLPYLWVTQLYPVRDKVGESVGYNGRDPSPEEMHLQMLESLAGGTKGFIHYIHSGSGGGRGGSGLNKNLWSSMGPMHKQIAAIGNLAARSTPVAWASTTTPKVHAQALLCDASNLLVVLTNDGIVSTKKDVRIPEIENANVTVSLPNWVHITDAVEVLPGGELSPRQIVPNKNTGASLTVARLGAGTVLWLKGAR